ncbi:MAG: PD-(D/E)XK nuclease family protein [Burkholderiaceae bacterium]
MTARAEPGPGRAGVRPERFAPSEPGGAAFWAAVAAALEPGLADPAGGPVAIVVPRAALIEPLRAALRARLATPGRPWAPPAIRDVAGWADEHAPAVPLDTLARSTSLLQALDDAMPDSLPHRAPTERLAFAGGLLDVLDAFARAGAAGRLDDPEWLAGITSAFGSPAAGERLREDLALLARIAHAASGEGFDPVAHGIDRMRRLAAAWTSRGTRVAWIAWQPPEPLDAVLLGELDTRMPTRLLRLEPDWTAIGATAPRLKAAWPECFEAGPLPPLRERRGPARCDPRGSVPTVLHAADREREAQLAAEWVHARLATARAAGRSLPGVAVVALDRWLARRVRALLERAEVLIDDREGWLLSTTVAATAAMGWLDVVVGDGYYDDLLGWLDSRFVRPAEHGPLRRWIERRAGRAGYLRGWDGLHEDDPSRPSPPSALDRLQALAAAQRRAQPLSAHLQALDAALRWAGAPQRLAADEAGRQVLARLDGLRRTAAGAAHDRSMPLAEFRALLALDLERNRFRGAIDSPVVMLTPGDAAGRTFDAVLVLGAADGLLPAAPAPLPLLNEPLRAMIGLPTAAQAAQRQQRDLVLLLALAGEAALTCRTDPSDGTRPSPWVERLEAIACDAPLARRVDAPGAPRTIRAAPAARPGQPIGRMPARLTVGGIERLVACPFRFLAQDGWRLREPDEPVDLPGVRERGQQVHAILERFHREVQQLGVPVDATFRAELRSRLVACTDAEAARVVAGGAEILGELAEWRATLDDYLDWAIGDAASGWTWLDGECSGAATLEWSGAAGPRSLRVEGRLDRVDLGPAGLRVVDYKLGGKERLGKLAAAPDRAAQLVMYAWFAQSIGEGAVQTTGYLSLRRRDLAWIPLAVDPDAALAQWRERVPAVLARIDAGEPLFAHGVDCQYCPSRGLCRKGHWA